MAEREKLNKIDLLNWVGLVTKQNNETQNEMTFTEAVNADIFRKYGAVSKPYGSRRILSTQYLEGGVAKAISWVGFFKITALNGQIDRQILCAAGTKLHKLNTNGTLTALTGSGKTITEDWVENLVHQHQIARDLMLITNQNPDLIGQGNTLVKYDGNEITRWGVRAPGDEANVEKRITSVGAAAPVGPNGTWIPSNGTAVNDSVTTRDGYAISLTKTSTASTNAYIEQSFDVGAGLVGHTAHADVVKVRVFIPLGELIKLANTNAIEIKMSHDTQVSGSITIPQFTSHAYTWNIPIGQLFEGWNELSLGFSTTSTALAYDDRLTITGSPTIGTLRSVRLGINSSSTGVLPAGIRFSQLQSFTRGNLTSVEGAAGSVFDGDSTDPRYSYKVTFVTKQGLESNAGPQSTDLTLTAGDKASINLTDIPTASDPQVIARKIYRTVAGGSVWVFVDTVENNSATTFTDTFSDANLGVDTPPEAGDPSLDNSPPPKISMMKLYKRTMFAAGDPSSPNRVIWSNLDEPEGFPLLNEAILDSKVTAIYEAYSNLVVETELGKWQVTGDNPDFRFNKIIVGIGCVGRQAAGETRLQGWAIDRDGMRLFDANNPVKISEPIRDKFEGFNKVNLERIMSLHSKNDNAIIMMVPDANLDFKNDNYVYQYPVDEVGQGGWWKLELPSSVNILDMEEIEDANGEFRLYASSEDGMIYEMFSRDSKNWATVTGTEAITTRIRTKWLKGADLIEDRWTGRSSLRFIELVHEGDPCTWNITIETALGPGQSTASSSTEVAVVFGDGKEKMMRYPVQMHNPHEYFRITAENSQTNVTSAILRIRPYFFVQPNQFPVETGTMNPDIDQPVE